MTIGEVSIRARALNDLINKNPDIIKQLTPIQYFRFLSIANALQEHQDNFQKAVQQLFEQHGATRQDNEDGTYQLKLPDEEIEKVNTIVAELQEEEIELNVKPLKIKEDDKIPFEFIEILFPWIEE